MTEIVYEGEENDREKEKEKQGAHIAQLAHCSRDRQAEKSFYLNLVNKRLNDISVHLLD